MQKSGSWYSYNNEKLGQGLDGAIKHLKENPKLAHKIEAEIRKQVATVSK